MIKPFPSPLLGKTGNIAGLSLVSAQSLLRSRRKDGVSAVMVGKEWRNLYHIGKAQNPPIAIVTSSIYLYLAWAVSLYSGPELDARQLSPHAAKLYAVAAVLTLGIIPWTLAVMRPTNNLLESHATRFETPASGADKQAIEIDAHLAKWKTLNLVRSLFPLAGSLVGTVATLF